MSQRAGVQSLERAFLLLTEMADAGGVVGVSDLAQRTGLALPTIHRLLRTLVELGYVRQEPDRRYGLGSGLLRLGEVASRRVGAWARPHLTEVAHELGESANLAILDGDEIVYIAQAPSRNSMRMFTEVGRRVLPHCTAVGKAILSHFTDPKIREIIARTGLPSVTSNTISDMEKFMAEISEIRQNGFAIDNGERELGVRCVAVPIPKAPMPAALSISGPETRVTAGFVEHAAKVLKSTARVITEELLTPRTSKM